MVVVVVRHVVDVRRVVDDVVVVVVSGVTGVARTTGDEVVIGMLSRIDAALFSLN